MRLAHDATHAAAFRRIRDLSRPVFTGKGIGLEGNAGGECVTSVRPFVHMAALLVNTYRKRANA